jgi:energy-coupling factor transporter ATP-binding protein EcfA2
MCNNLLKSQKIINKIIHISDIHIERNNKRQEEYLFVFHKLFRKLKNLIIHNNEYNYIICITGDIIDFKSNVTNYGAKMLKYFITNLANISPIIIIPGNHDVNVYEKNSIDLISTIIDNVRTSYRIYYLKYTGIYKYCNIIFSVLSVYKKDNKFINYQQIIDNNDNKSYDKIIFLFHGFVKSKKVSYIFTGLDISKVAKYDIALLGDIHQHVFLKTNVAYAGSLIQRNYGESVLNHGFVLWDVNTCTGKHLSIRNKWQFINYEIKNNNNTSDYIIFSKYTRLKLKYTNCSKLFIDNVIKHISEETNIVEIRRENIKHNHNEKYDNVGDVIIIISAKFENIHNKYLEKINNNNNNNNKKTFYLEKLSFSNLFCFGENNELIIEKNEITGIVAENYSGKSSIVDGLLYALFDRTVRNTGNDKISLLNIDKNELELQINFHDEKNNYIIHKKFMKDTNTRSIEIYINDNIDIRETYLQNHKYVLEIINQNFENFMITSTMTQYNQINFLDIDNNRKKTILLNIFDYDYIDNISKIAKKDLLCQENEYNLITSNIKRINENIENMNIDHILYLDLQEKCKKLNYSKYTFNKINKKINKLKYQKIKIIQELILKKHNNINYVNLGIIKEKIRILTKCKNKYYETKYIINKFSKIKNDIAKKYVYEQELIENYKNLTIKDDKILFLKEYIDELSDDGIKYRIYECICNVLEIEANNILKVFSEIEINIIVSYKYKRLCIDVFKNINKNTNKNINAINCSGYEKLAINIAIKVALYKLSKKSNFSIFIMDESISCIDKWNLDSIDKLFDYLKHIYNHVLIITHNNDIQNKFDNVITIEKNINGNKLIN